MLMAVLSFKRLLIASLPSSVCRGIEFEPKSLLHRIPACFCISAVRASLSSNVSLRLNDPLPCTQLFNISNFASGRVTDRSCLRACHV